MNGENTERLLSLAQVRELIPLSKPEIYRRIKRGEFPRQVHLGPCRVAWAESEIQDWIEHLKEKRDAPAVT